jgi:hypothetical protein
VIDRESVLFVGQSSRVKVSRRQATLDVTLEDRCGDRIAEGKSAWDLGGKDDDLYHYLVVDLTLSDLRTMNIEPT